MNSPKRGWSRRRWSASTLGASVGAATGLVAPPARAFANEGTIKGRVQLRRGKRLKRDHSGAVVFLKGVEEKLPNVANVVHEIRQVNRTFVPEVSVVLVGTTLSFPNDDRIFHNVFSLSEAETFDLGRYKSGTTRTRKTSKAGIIEVFCDVHEEMAATVLVLDTTRFGKTNSSGEFTIPAVPPGDYEWVAWVAWSRTVSGRVTVEPGGVSELEAELKQGRPPRHLDKNGAPYGRYK